MSFSNSSIRTVVSAMPTIQITETIASFAKKVCCISFLSLSHTPTSLPCSVGRFSRRQGIEAYHRIKRNHKVGFLSLRSLQPSSFSGKTTLIGPRRISLASKNLKLGLATITFPLRCASIEIYPYIFNFLLCRPPRSVLWLIFRIARILKGFASSITWSKTSRSVCPNYLPFSPYLKNRVSA